MLTDTQNVQLWYDTALKQIAAESYYDDINFDFQTRDSVVTALRRGNTPPNSSPEQYVRMTSTQASDFLDRYKIVDQLPNTSSGFSATVLFDNTTQKYSLVFRSTEFKNASKGGDFERDGYDGAGGELFNDGFAYGQLRDMEAYLSQLKVGLLSKGTNEDGLALLSYLDGGGKFEIDGYSLGAHMATAFTELHPELVSQTVVFNAAGVGQIGNRTRPTYSASLQHMLARFEEVLANPNSANLDSSTLTDQEQLIRAGALQATTFPAAGTSGSNGSSVYSDFRYQWARIAISKEFQTTGFRSISSPGTTVGLDSYATALITQLYGHATHDDLEATANSGVHAPARPIFIEDQPEVEGFPKLPFAARATANFPGDFANTHSLTLIIDSLAVMRAFMLVDSSLSQRDVETILAGSSNQRAKPFVGVGASDAAEGNSLENALDALRRLFNPVFVSPAEVQPTDFDSRAGGFGDPALREGFYRNLDEFLALGDNIRDKYSIRSFIPATQFFGDNDGSRNGEPKPQIVLPQADGILAGVDEGGEVGLAYRYALRELNPFVVIDTQNNGLYARFQADGPNVGELDFYNASTAPQGLTPQYLQDRAAFLERKLYLTTLNLNKFYQNPNVSNPSSLPNALDPRGQGYQQEAKYFEDRASSFIAASGSPNRNSEQQFIFGTTGADVIEGAGLEDHLYGGGGTDYLAGKAGDDYLEGGTGLDLYDYKSARNVLLGGSNDGTDTLRDANGRGVLRYSYANGSASPLSTVIAEASVKVNATTWQSADGKFEYEKTPNDQGGTDLVVTIVGDAGGGLRLKDFKDGDFGVHLWQPRATPGFAATIQGDFERDPSAEKDAFGNPLPGASAPNRDDALFGGRPLEASDPSAPGEKIVAGGGNDVVFSDQPFGQPDNGLGNADWVSGGAGRDVLWTGAGNDLVEAGGDGVASGDIGGDIVDGGLGDDELYAEQRLNADPSLNLRDAIVNGNLDNASGQKGDFLSGGAGDDWLIGDRGNDALNGGGGSDLIVGGAGDDTIDGDSGDRAQTLAWTVTRSVLNDGTVYETSYSGVASADNSAGGADTIYGGSGADWVSGRAGDDFIDGGSGDDVLFGDAGSDIIIGGTGNDNLSGDSGDTGAMDDGADYLDGGAGDDQLFGNGGDDILIGGAGNDTLAGGAGQDIYLFSKGDGRDVVYDDSTGMEKSILVFGEGYDQNFVLRPGSMLLDFGDGDSVDLGSFDHFDPNAAAPFEALQFADGTTLGFQEVLARGFTVDGTEDNDDAHDAAHPQSIGTAFRDHIRSFGGNDVLFGLQGDDLMEGGAGADELQGGEGDDYLIGDGADVAFAQQGNDRLFGGAGNDFLSGGDGNDNLSGDEGDDEVLGGAGDDILFGGAGADRLEGGSGNDALTGGAGDDQLFGNGGNDELFGGEGNDLVDGGEGRRLRGRAAQMGGATIGFVF